MEALAEKPSVDIRISKGTPPRKTNSLHSSLSSVDNNEHLDKSFIPPPAGFGSSATRPFSLTDQPRSLLAALVRGPVSLDEASLSPATQRRLAYLQRYSKSSFHIQSIVKEEKRGNGEGNQLNLSKNDYFGLDLPTSPLSPPSPFQHPFFRQKLGMATDAWNRFSGFGLPRFNAFQNEEIEMTETERKNVKTETVMEKSEKVPISNGGKRHMTSTRSVLRYCETTKSYKVCRETQFFAESYNSDAISETDSDEDDYEEFTSPSNTRDSITNGIKGQSGLEGTFQGILTDINNLTTGEGNSNAFSDLNKPQHGFTLLQESNTNLIVNNGDLKRHSKATSSELDFEEISSQTASDLDSFHDAPSPRSSLHSPESGDVTPDSAYSANRSPQDEDHLGYTRIDKDEDIYENMDSPKAMYDEEETYENVENLIDNNAQNLYKIVMELLQTERSYVKVLHVIDQEFQFRVDKENRLSPLLPPGHLPLIFANVKSIYKLHHDFLLPQLEQRISHWEEDSRIGDLMKSFAPFLKMYTEYVSNFNNAMTLISDCQNKCSRFAAIMQEIHSLEECGNLTLQHHMLCPVQRIPRYEMLLRDYLRKLPLDSPDWKDTEEALHLVSTAAQHANDAMKKIDHFQKLLEVQESLGGAIDLVSPTRRLLKEGRIIKISARSQDHQERYLFLLSDLLLLCSHRLMGSRVISGPQYRLRARYNVENLEVLEGDNLETANTFYIRDNNKTVELYTQTKEEKSSWLEDLFYAIHDTYQRKSSLRLGPQTTIRSCDSDLGQKRPTLIRLDSVQKCMECAGSFSVVRRKRHCRACGIVACTKCSNFKASLPCENGKSVRICATCYEFLNTKKTENATPDTANVETRLPNERPTSNGRLDEEAKLSGNFDDYKTRGVLEVSGQCPDALYRGFLQLKTHRKAWVKRWFVLRPDFVLYSFRDETDTHALTATPVPGFTIMRLQAGKGESGLSEKDREKAFKLYHSKKQYIFQATNKEEAMKWSVLLTHASQAELPSPTLQE